jgi:23S rRNA (adenine2503-C2)-methyltransferase
LQADPLIPKINLLGYDRAALVEYFATLGEKSFRAQQVLQWIHARGIADFEQMTNLSKKCRETLTEQCEIKGLSVITEKTAPDGTRKWLFDVGASNAIETVYIPEPKRATLCISSQVGCILNCRFCHTAQQGFQRNLTADEIIGQVWHVATQLRREGVLVGEDRPISNVVFMGMGEPLLNFDNVLKSINIMLDDLAYGLSKRRVTVSTSGVIPGIDKLAQVSDVALALSLHAPNDTLRSQIVPLNKKYPIAELLASCKRYLGTQQTRRRITMEYVMLAGVNDQPHHARELAKLLRDIPSKVNLIPFNPFVGTNYQRSDMDTIETFQEIVMQAGIVATIRKTRGDEIDAACGQLAGQVKDRTSRQQKFKDSLNKVIPLSVIA